MREPYFQLIYQGRDITSQFSMWPTDITYTDHHHGKADEVTVKVHNSTGQWLDVWEPQSGDKFSLRYGYKDQHAPAGTFSVDESSASGDANGDTFDFKGLSAAKTKELRTEKHKAYEKQSLSDVVNKIASEHGLQMEGEIEDIDFERITQNGESDLAFLKRLADDYGHYFKVSSDKSVCTSRDALRSSEPARVYDRLETGENRAIKSYTLRDADGVVQAVLLNRGINFYESETWRLNDDGTTTQLALPLKGNINALVAGQMVVTTDQDWTAPSGQEFKTGDVIAWNLQAWLADPKTPAQLVIRPGEREAIEGINATRNTLVVALYENVRAHSPVGFGR